MLRALEHHGVRYLIVGGLAFVYHAKPRFTKDLDLWVDPASENIRRANLALAEFGSPYLMDEDENANGAWDCSESDAARADTDGDGMPDGSEIVAGTGPFVAGDCLQIGELATGGTHGELRWEGRTSGPSADASPACAAATRQAGRGIPTRESPRISRDCRQAGCAADGLARRIG